MKIEELGLAPRITNALAKGGVNTVSQLYSITEANLLKKDGIGEAAVVKIILALQEHREKGAHEEATKDAEAELAVEKPVDPSITQLRPVIDVYDLIESMLIEAEGEFTEEIEALVEEADHSFSVSVDALCTLVKQFEGSAGVLKTEVDRLGALKRSRETAATSLKHRLSWAMGERDQTTVETDLFRVNRVRNSNMRVEVTCASEDLPDHYAHQPTPPDTSMASDDDEAHEIYMEWVSNVIRLARVASPTKIKEHFAAEVEKWYQLFKSDTTAYLEHIDEMEERMTVEEAAWSRAQQDLPTGVTVEQGYHVRIR